MHCPSCGQQQVSNETKFCSRCGMPLSVVAEVVSYGGYLPQLAELNRDKSVFTKKNGAIFSLFWFIFFTCFMTAFFGILGAADEFVGILAITGFFGGLMILMSSLIFFKSAKLFVPNVLHPPPSSTFHGQNQQVALPPQQSIPVNAYNVPQAGNWRDTNDLQPTSATESTTRLLNDEERR